MHSPYKPNSVYIQKIKLIHIKHAPVVATYKKERGRGKKKKRKGNTLGTSPRNHMLYGKPPLSQANPSRQSFVLAFAVKVCHSSLSRGEKFADPK